MTTDWSKAKRGPVIPPDPRKVRITIRLDRDIVDHFKQKVLDAGGGSYQNLMNEALRQHMAREDGALEDMLRRVIREELAGGEVTE